MLLRKIMLYALAVSLPLALAICALQAERYDALREDVRRLNTVQERWIESNKLLITDIAELSSPERIERMAEDELGLSKKRPEDVLQVRIEKTGTRLD